MNLNFMYNEGRLQNTQERIQYLPKRGNNLMKCSYSIS